MPLKKGTSLKNCISINYKELIKSGKSDKVAQAAALNFCHGKWGGAPKKDKKKESIDFTKLDIEIELEALNKMKDELNDIG